MIGTDIRVEMQGGKRFYCFPDGRRYPSVTTHLQVIDKPQVDIWRGRVGNEEADRIRDEGADIGTLVHSLTEKGDRLGINEFLPLPFDTPQFIYPMLEAWATWKRQYVEEILYTELVVWSDTFQYAGRIDRVLIFKGDILPTVVDIKTSNELDATVPLQLVAYAEALKESRGIQTGRYVAIRLDKRKTHKLPWVREYVYHASDFRAFTYAIGLWRYMNE